MKNIIYTKTETNQIELSINNQIFFLEWDEITFNTLIFDWSNLTERDFKDFIKKLLEVKPSLWERFKQLFK